MSEKYTMKLSKQEQTILSDVIAAANVSTEKYNIDIAIGDEVGMKTLKTVEPLMDLFLLVDKGNAKAISHLTGEDGDKVILAYKPANLKTAYSPDDVQRLKHRIKGAIKESASKNKILPRTLYIADCHFYHNRLCHEMDKRGFSGFEEMNEHMIKRWNEKVTNRDTVYILGDSKGSRDSKGSKVSKVSRSE